MYLLVTREECQELMELSYACSRCSLKNGETWFDQERWTEAVKKIIGEESFALLPKQGSVDIVVFRSQLPEKRVVETLPPDPVSDIVERTMKTMRILEPRDFLTVLASTWP